MRPPRSPGAGARDHEAIWKLARRGQGESPRDAAYPLADWRAAFDSLADRTVIGRPSLGRTDERPALSSDPAASRRDVALGAGCGGSRRPAEECDDLYAFVLHLPEAEWREPRRSGADASNQFSISCSRRFALASVGPPRTNSRTCARSSRSRDRRRPSYARWPRADFVSAALSRPRAISALRRNSLTFARGWRRAGRITG